MVRWAIDNLRCAAGGCGAIGRLTARDGGAQRRAQAVLQRRHHGADDVDGVCCRVHAGQLAGAPLVARTRDAERDAGAARQAAELLPQNDSAYLQFWRDLNSEVLEPARCVGALRRRADACVRAADRRHRVHCAVCAECVRNGAGRRLPPATRAQRRRCLKKPTVVHALRSALRFCAFTASLVLALLCSVVVVVVVVVVVIARAVTRQRSTGRARRASHVGESFAVVGRLCRRPSVGRSSRRTAPRRAHLTDLALPPQRIERRQRLRRTRALSRGRGNAQRSAIGLPANDDQARDQRQQTSCRDAAKHARQLSGACELFCTHTHTHTHTHTPVRQFARVVRAQSTRSCDGGAERAISTRPDRC